MKKILELRVKKISDRLSRELTLEQIINLLDSNTIAVRGNLTNTPKKSLLLDSLRGAKETALVKFVENVESHNKPIEREDSTIFLHSDFRGTKVEKFFITGDYEEAVRVAFVRINNRIKLATGLAQDGAALMREVFTPNNPLIRINALVSQTDRDEQEGIMHIFEGTMLAFRNPPSHDDEKKLSPGKANEILQLANYLMDLLDASI